MERYGATVGEIGLGKQGQHGALVSRFERFGPSLRTPIRARCNCTPH